MYNITTWGNVTKISPKVKVEIEGETTSTTIISGLSGYTPTLGDKVVLLKSGNSWIILGKVITL